MLLAFLHLRLYVCMSRCWCLLSYTVIYYQLCITDLWILVLPPYPFNWFLISEEENYIPLSVSYSLNPFLNDCLHVWWCFSISAFQIACMCVWRCFSISSLSISISSLSNNQGLPAKSHCEALFIRSMCGPKKVLVWSSFARAMQCNAMQCNANA